MNNQTNQAITVEKAELDVLTTELEQRVKNLKTLTKELIETL